MSQTMPALDLRMEMCERDILLQDVYRKIDEAEEDVAKGNVKDAIEALKRLRVKYGI